ncbi:MAG: multicopper oxidase family protein [Candidatus Geothermincolia bacterium]
MISRREFLKYTTMAGVGLAVPGTLKNALRHEEGVQLSASPALAKFVDALPIPTARTPVGTQSGAPLYQVTMRQVTQKLHRDLAATRVWTYDGAFPSFTFETRTNETIYVNYTNSLPAGPHFLPVDTTLPSMAGLPNIARVVTHVHGAEVEAAFDGGPANWFAPGASRLYRYTNVQQATTLWYHDHSMAFTRLNVYAGLAGFYLVRDAVEDSLNLPKGAYEIPVVIQDRTFNPDGSLNYPSVGVTPVHPVWVPEFFGDVSVVNGKCWPFLQVEPRKYRFRLLNGCNARFLVLALTSGQPFIQIGTDGGLLATPVENTRLTMAPAERCDCILDFTGMAGQTVTMKNFGAVPFPMGGGGPAIPDIMQFQVTKPLAGPDTSSRPAALRPVYRIPEGLAGAVRDLALTEVLVGGASTGVFLEGKAFMDPVDVLPELGAIEQWRFINLTGDTHPIHLHLVQFQIIDRRPFDVARYQATGQIRYTGAATPPAANEMGWKDTAMVTPGNITRYAVKLVSYAGDYVFHCHIIEHEDNDMMRPYRSVPSVYYFAEGTCRPNFDPYLTLDNHNGAQAGIRVTYMLGNGQTKVQNIAVAPYTRFTITVKDILGEGDDVAHDFSAKVESTNGIQFVAERVMYFNYKGKWTGGSAVVGALSPAPAWYFAEGTCRPGFDAYLTIQNPNATTSNVTITYMLGDGTSKTQTTTVPATSRKTVFVKDFLGEANDVAHDFSAKVATTNAVNIVAERSIYFDYNGWTGGNAVVGSLGAATSWYFAEGTCRPDFDPFITIQNPLGAGADVTVTYLKGDGTAQQQTLTVGPTSRATIRVRDVLGVGDDVAHDFSTKVETTGEGIIVERPMYFNYKGVWSGGSCVMGETLPFARYYFAEGSTRPNFDTYLTIMNPDPVNDAPVTITYALGDGTLKQQKVTATHNSRTTVAVADVLGHVDSAANDFSTQIVSDNGVQIVVERPEYFNYKGAWTGGHCVVGFTY